MSLTPSSSPYLSSSSSVETTLSSSSLSGSHSPSSSLDHSRKESWDEGDGSLLVRRTHHHLPPSQQNDDDDWKGGVSLRKGWEFLEKGGGGAAAYGKGGFGGGGKGGGGGGGGNEEANRVSVAETVKPPQLSLTDLPPSPSSWITGKSPSSSSSLAAAAAGESEDLTTTLPTPPSFANTTAGGGGGSDDVQPPPGSTSTSNSSSTTSLSLLNRNGVRPLPAPQTSSASSSTKGSIRPLPTPPSLLVVVGDQTASSTSTSTSTSSSVFPAPPSSTLRTEQPQLPSRQRSATNTTATLVNDTASLSASTSTTASSSSSSSSSRSSTPSPPPPTSASTTSNLGPTHQRSFSAQPQPHLQPPPSSSSSSSHPSLSISTASAPSLPLKPTWLQSKALPASPTSPGRRPSTAPTTLEVPSGGPNAAPRPTHSPSHSHSNHLSIRRTNTPPSSSPLPLSPAPLLPPRPTPQVQKHVAKAEFAPSSLPSSLPSTSSSNGTRPTHAPSHSVSGGGGMRNRLAAWGGMVGGVAGAVYSESNAYFNQPMNEQGHASSSSTTNGGTTKSPKPLHQVLFSAPGTAVRHLNSSWRASSNGKLSSSSTWGNGGGGGARRVTSYDPNGPAGVLVAAGEGRVFGREVGEVVREGWGLAGKGGFGGGGEGKTLGVVNGKGREVLPALVVRCVDYLETWGPREEGIFRISGRATHVQKLRNQFDTGADIDLALSDPSDLDPHAVASVFKAYLRELPSPILTSTLTPSFDVVLRKSTGSPARDQGFGVSSVARPEGSLKGGEQKAALLKEVKELLEKLPEVHWWLLKAVVCLLDHTSKFSHENKMTLSNLLLVFCPSLCLSPPFLRLLVENHPTLLDKSPADLNSTSTALPSNPPLLPPRPKADNNTNPNPNTSSVVPPSTPTRKKMTMTIDPPRLDVRLPSTSPLPSFATLAKEESSSGSGQTSTTGWESPAKKKGGLKTKLGVVPVASEGTGGASPSAWNGGGGAGSMGGKKKRNLSSPPDRSTSSGSNNDNGDGTEEILASSSSASNMKDRASMFSSSSSRKKNGSFVDLQASVPPPQSSLLFSPPPPTTTSGTSSTRRASEETKPSPSPSPSSPATDAPPTDVLPPSGVVAARRHIFGTPISDRFKSTTTPTFHSFRRSGNVASNNSNNSPSPDPGTASLPDLAVKPFHRGGGGFFGSSNHKVVPVAGSVPLKSSESSGSASGKRGGMWKRGSAMVGLGGGHGGAGGLEEGVGRTVLDAVKALEGGGGGGAGATRG